jgi:hypothetical protein
MSRLAKAFLLLELTICFAPVAILLFLGMFIIPMGLIFGPTLELGNLAALAMVVAGALGMHALLTVVSALMSGKRPKLSPRLILIFAAIGCVPLLPIVIGRVDSSWWRLVGLLPLLAGAHVIYLARAHLFEQQAPAA